MQKAGPGEKKILAASARTWSSNLLIVNLVLHTIELSLFPTPDTSLWRYITIPHLVTKGSAVPKISSGQTLFHLFGFFANCCDFDLEHSNPILSLKTLAIKFIYLSYLPSNYTSGCQKIVRRYIVETVIFWWYKPSLSDLGLGDSNCTFSHNILLGNNDASPYQIWLQQVERFRKYLLGKSWKDGHGWFQYTPLQWCTTQHNAAETVHLSSWQQKFSHPTVICKYHYSGAAVPHICCLAVQWTSNAVDATPRLTVWMSINQHVSYC